MFLDSKLELLQEVYYGKNPLLLAVEKEVEKIRQKVMLEPYYDPNGTPENDKICELFSELFNCEDVFLDWTMTKVGVNSMTYPISFFLNQGTEFYDVKRGPHGIQFVDKKGKVLYIITYTNFFTEGIFTSSEWVAIILHEIGHNFYNNSYHVVSGRVFISFSVLMYLLQIVINSPDQLSIGVLLVILQLYLLFTPEGRKEFKIIVEKYYPKIVIKILTIFGDILITSLTILAKFLRYAIFPFSLLHLGMRLPIYFLTHFLPRVFILDGYYNEKFADNFASSYGYGPEISSLFEKFFTKPNTPVDRVINKIPVLNEIDNFYNFIEHSMINLIDEHPDISTRIAEQSRMLRSELKKKKYPDKMKKQILKDIERVETVYSDYSDLQKKTEDKMALVCIVRLAWISFFGKPEDIREMILRTRNDYNYDQMLPQKERDKLGQLFPEYIKQGFFTSGNFEK